VSAHLVTVSRSSPIPPHRRCPSESRKWLHSTSSWGRKSRKRHDFSPFRTPLFLVQMCERAAEAFGTKSAIPASMRRMSSESFGRRTSGVPSLQRRGSTSMDGFIRRKSGEAAGRGDVASPEAVQVGPIRLGLIVSAWIFIWRALLIPGFASRILCQRTFSCCKLK
jgi:hypothetical protein